MHRLLLSLFTLVALQTSAAAAMPVNTGSVPVIHPVKARPFYFTMLEQKLGRPLKWKERIAVKWAVNRQLKQAKKHKMTPESAHRLGVTSLMCGAGSFLFLFIPGLNMITPVLALVAIIFGGISLSNKSKKNPEAVWGIVLGSVFLILMLIAIATLTINFA